MATEIYETQKLLVYYKLLSLNLHRTAEIFAECVNFQPKPNDELRLRYLFSTPFVKRYGPGILLKVKKPSKSKSSTFLKVKKPSKSKSSTFLKVKKPSKSKSSTSTSHQSCISYVHPTEMAPNNPPAPQILFRDSSADSDISSCASSDSPSYDVSSWSSGSSHV